MLVARNVPPKAACMAEPLCLGKICLPTLQLLRQSFLLSHICPRSEEPVENDLGLPTDPHPKSISKAPDKINAQPMSALPDAFVIVLVWITARFLEVTST